jgi:hypothetical protein
MTPTHPSPFRRYVALTVVAVAAATVLAIVAPVGALAPSVVHAQADGIVAEPALAEVEFGTEIRFKVRARSARSSDPITTVQLLYRIDDSPVQNTGIASFQPGEAVNAAYRWRVTGVLLPGTDVHYQFAFETASGSRRTTPEQTITYNDTRFDWRTVGTGNVVAHWTGADPAIGQAVFDEATRAVSRIEGEFGIAPDRPVHVYGYVRVADYASAVATGGRNLDYATAAGANRVYFLYQQDKLQDALLSLRREVARAVFEQRTSNAFAPPPKWLALGFSRYVAGEDVSADNQKALTDLAQNDRLLSLKSLGGNLPTTGQERALAQEQALSAVKYLAQTYSPEKVRATLDAFREGSTVDDAFKRGLGNTLDQFESRWKTSLRMGLPQKANVANPTPRPGMTSQAATSTASQGSSSNTSSSSSAGPESLAFVDSIFGNSVDFWKGIFGESTRYVLVGTLGFMSVAVLAIVIGTIVGTVRKARDEY